MTTQDLAALRKSLDDIDAVLVSALGERARLARQIAKVKAEGDGPVRDADRETALLQHRSAFGERLGLDPAFVRRIFREILDDSVRRQQDALQTSGADGEAGNAGRLPGHRRRLWAPGRAAALRRHAAAGRLQGVRRPSGTMLEAVIEGHADRAMLPIENTTAGSVYESYDLLLRFNLSLVGEEIVDVRHCLLGVADVPLESLRRIHSHPQALSQCSEFLASLPRVRGRGAANTALAAQHVRDLNDPTEAAIASEEAGAHFGLHVLKRDIANQPVNYTRFVVVAAAPVECDPRIAAKVSMVLATRHEHGALVRCLNIIADEGLNVTKLESRPRPGTPWEYVFYIDVEGHIARRACRRRWPASRRGRVFLKVLGCYPARELPR